MRKSLAELACGFFDSLKTSEKFKTNDILCFKRCLGRFLDTGLKQDAFDVFFCFSEIFMLFGTGYDNTDKLLETLSDHEYHAGELLTKHRDHYSHSAYVFALGLAIYDKDNTFKKEFLKFYGIEEELDGAEVFLNLWGLTALFHDVGYPFELAFEQIKRYVGEICKKNKEKPFVTFGNLDKFIKLNKNEYKNLNELFAHGLNVRFGYDENKVCKYLSDRIAKPDKYLDHAYFSAVILARQMFAKKDFEYGEQILDVLTAILMHNSLNFKRNKEEDLAIKPVSPKEHPLAYLLMLCDELQNWDRFPYGKESKKAPLAFDVKLNISDNSIDVDYVFEGKDLPSKNNNGKQVKNSRKTKENINKSNIESGKFVKEIFGSEDDKAYTGNITLGLKLEVSASTETRQKRNELYASEDSFINLCDFAKAIHALYCKLTKKGNIYVKKNFSELELEYKISNIGQAKSYAKKLELVNCFYSNKVLDYDQIKRLNNIGDKKEAEQNFEILCRAEHVRWAREKIELGWEYGVEGKDYTRENREKKRLNRCLVPYENLTKDDKEKDENAIKNVISLLRKYGNDMRVYCYRHGVKPILTVAGIGHRFFEGNISVIKQAVTTRLLELSKNNRVVVMTSFAYGADQLIAECANKLGLEVKGVLPMPYEDFIAYVREDALKNGRNYTPKDESNLRLLLAQTTECEFFKDKKDCFKATAEYCINNCDKVIAIWDGQKVNRAKYAGGTYDCICRAKKRGLKQKKDIFIINCER